MTKYTIFKTRIRAYKWLWLGDKYKPLGILKISKMKVYFIFVKWKGIMSATNLTKYMYWCQDIVILIFNFKFSPVEFMWCWHKGLGFCCWTSPCCIHRALAVTELVFSEAWLQFFLEWSQNKEITHQQYLLSKLSWRVATTVQQMQRITWPLKQITSK